MVASSLFNGSLLVSSIFYEQILSFFSAFVFGDGRVDSGYHSLSTKPAQHDPPPALPYDERRPNRVLLLGPALYSCQRRRHRSPPDKRTGLHLICALLAGREANSVYLGIRWQQRSLRH